MVTKICRICKQEKDISEFYKDTKAPDGHTRECKECRKQIVIGKLREKGIMPKPPKKTYICQRCGTTLERSYKYCPECKIIVRNEINRLKYQNMEEEAKRKRLAQQSKYIKTHAEKLQEYRENYKRYKAANPKRVWAEHSVNAKRRDPRFTVTLTIEQLEVKATHTTHCPICGCELQYGQKQKRAPIPCSPSLDRLDNEDLVANENTWIICYKCNQTKSNRTYEEFIEYCKIVIESSKVSMGS